MALSTEPKRGNYIDGIAGGDRDKFEVQKAMSYVEQGGGVTSEVEWAGAMTFWSARW